jgi:hypothetical protein
MTKGEREASQTRFQAEVEADVEKHSLMGHGFLGS